MADTFQTLLPALKAQLTLKANTGSQNGVTLPLRHDFINHGKSLGFTLLDQEAKLS